MTDGTGVTVCGYNLVTVPATLGAGQLATLDGPLANDTALGYDELGRTTSLSINGTANVSTASFDSLGREYWRGNNLGNSVTCMSALQPASDGE